MKYFDDESLYPGQRPKITLKDIAAKCLPELTALSVFASYYWWKLGAASFAHWLMHHFPYFFGIGG